METEGDVEVGALRGLSLAVSLVLVGTAYPLGGWACDRWLPGFYGESEGGGGVFATFFLLPLAAGMLACFALWRMTKAAAIVSGLAVCAGSFLVAAIAC